MTMGRRNAAKRFARAKQGGCFAVYSLPCAAQRVARIVAARIIIPFSSVSLEVVREVLSASPLVDEVVYQTSLVEALNTNLRKIGLVLGVLILLLLFISFVLIGNMVRLNVFSRRFTIHTMQLVGATRGFIRAPFIGQSALQGLFAALVAIALLVAGLFILRREFVQLFEIFQLRTLLITMGIVVVSGVVICVASTWIVVGRLVRFDRDQLYAI